MLFFFNDTATTEIYTLSLHDALPILAYNYDKVVNGKNVRQDLGNLSLGSRIDQVTTSFTQGTLEKTDKKTDFAVVGRGLDRKSTRLNSSHANIQYAVFCLKKKNLHTHNVNRCVRGRHLSRTLSLRRKRSIPNVFELAATETLPSIILMNLISVSLDTIRHP